MFKKGKRLCHLIDSHHGHQLISRGFSYHFIVILLLIITTTNSYYNVIVPHYHLKIIVYNIVQVF